MQHGNFPIKREETDSGRRVSTAGEQGGFRGLHPVHQSDAPVSNAARGPNLTHDVQGLPNAIALRPGQGGGPQRSGLT